MPNHDESSGHISHSHAHFTHRDHQNERHGFTFPCGQFQKMTVVPWRISTYLDHPVPSRTMAEVMHSRWIPGTQVTRVRNGIYCHMVIFICKETDHVDPSFLLQTHAIQGFIRRLWLSKLASANLYRRRRRKKEFNSHSKPDIRG